MSTKQFEVGQVVTLSVQGAGTLSKEHRTISEIKDGVIHLEDSSITFNLDGTCTEVDTLFGFKLFWIK